MADTANVKVGVCSVTFNGTDLGYTKGGIEFSVTTEKYSVTVDQFGNTPISEIITSRVVNVTTPLAETSLENLVLVMPGSTLVTDGTDPTKKRVDVTDAVSTDLLPLAEKLVLHPQALAVADVSEDVIVPQAATAGSLNFAYVLDSERVYNVEWVGYPDPTTRILFQYGDESATA